MRLDLSDPARPRLYPDERSEDEQIEVFFAGREHTKAMLSLLLRDQVTGETWRYTMTPARAASLAIGLSFAAQIAEAGPDGVRITIK